MKRDKYILLAIFAVVIALFVLGANWYRSYEEKRSASLTSNNAEPLVRSYSPVLGPAEAKVTVVEFLDPECESCAAFFPVVKKVMSEYNGKVRLVVRYLPLHPNSAFAVGILEGARKQGKFWEALEMLFVRQAEWASHHQPRPELIMGYMRDLGLDLDQLKSSIQDSEHRNRLLQDQADGAQLKVTRTPTFFVNGKELLRLGYEDLRLAIDGELRK